MLLTSDRCHNNSQRYSGLFLRTRESVRWTACLSPSVMLCVQDRVVSEAIFRRHRLNGEISLMFRVLPLRIHPTWYQPEHAQERDRVPPGFLRRYSARCIVTPILTQQT